MPETKEKRQSRITVACNACRARKQKCSGDKPICEQCLEYHRPCDWPEQLRRGPAKGHVEALEHRLQLTEGVLLRLLAEIPDGQLSSMFPDNPDPKNGRSSYTPLARLEKKGVTNWSDLPLDTARNIRKWEEACTNQMTTPTNEQSIEEPIQPPPKAPNPIIEENEPLAKKRKYNSQFGNHLRYMAVHPHHPTQKEPKSLSPSPPQVPNPETIGTLKDRTSRSVCKGMFAGVWPLEREPIAHTLTRGELPPSKENPSSWEGAPSLNFQQQFLW